jgi:hypothetical protein
VESNGQLASMLVALSVTSSRAVAAVQWAACLGAVRLVLLAAALLGAAQLEVVVECLVLLVAAGCLVLLAAAGRLVVLAAVVRP